MVLQYGALNGSDEGPAFNHVSKLYKSASVTLRQILSLWFRSQVDWCAVGFSLSLCCFPSCRRDHLMNAELYESKQASKQAQFGRLITDVLLAALRVSFVWRHLCGTAADVAAALR